MELPVNIWVSFIQTLAYHEMGRYSRYKAGWDAAYKVCLGERFITILLSQQVFVHPQDLAIAFITRRRLA